MLGIILFVCLFVILFTVFLLFVKFWFQPELVICNKIEMVLVLLSTYNTSALLLT